MRRGRGRRREIEGGDDEDAAARSSTAAPATRHVLTAFHRRGHEGPQRETVMSPEPESLGGQWSTSRALSQGPGRAGVLVRILGRVLGVLGLLAVQKTAPSPTRTLEPPRAPSSPRMGSQRAPEPREKVMEAQRLERPTVARRSKGDWRSTGRRRDAGAGRSDDHVGRSGPTVERDRAARVVLGARIDRGSRVLCHLAVAGPPMALVATRRRGAQRRHPEESSARPASDGARWARRPHLEGAAEWAPGVVRAHVARAARAGGEHASRYLRPARGSSRRRRSSRLPAARGPLH